MSFLNLLEAFFGFISNNYGSELENYINSRNPQNEGDVERFTREYNYSRKW